MNNLDGIIKAIQLGIFANVNCELTPTDCKTLLAQLKETRQEARKFELAFKHLLKELGFMWMCGDPPVKEAVSEIQRMQELIKRSGVEWCPDCHGGGLITYVDKPPQKCRSCNGKGYVIL